MSKRFAFGALVLAAGVAIALPSIAGAGGRAETKVTIKAPGGDVFGQVKSERPKRCADERLITVFREKGGEQGGGDDIKVGSDTSAKSGDKYVWSIGQPGVQGKKIYARAKRTEHCKADNSRTIRAGTT